MSFIFTADNLLISRWDGSDFQEATLSISGAGGVTVTQAAGSASFTISGADTAELDAEYVRLDGSNGPMTGELLLSSSGTPTAPNAAANKQYVDEQVSSAAIHVEDQGVAAVNSAGIIDFRDGLAVTSGGAGRAEVSVDESELTTVVFLAGNQTISGVKTFADDAVFEGNATIQGDLTVNGTTTTLDTQQLLVEDNLITLNSTASGSPTLDAGIEVNRGTDPFAVLYFDESNDYWVAGISGSEERLLLAGDLLDINNDIATLSGLIDQNAADIATVSGLVDQNAADIATVSGLVDPTKSKNTQKNENE